MWILLPISVNSDSYVSKLLRDSHGISAYLDPLSSFLQLIRFFFYFFWISHFFRSFLFIIKRLVSCVLSVWSSALKMPIDGSKKCDVENMSRFSDYHSDPIYFPNELPMLPQKREVEFWCLINFQNTIHNDTSIVAWVERRVTRASETWFHSTKCLSPVKKMMVFDYRYLNYISVKHTQTHYREVMICLINFNVINSSRR